jgi:site-specific DNA-methyltransferase (adenine-specific)
MTSPPYWGLRNYGTPKEIGSESTPDLYLLSMNEILSELYRVLKPNGNVFIVIGDKYARTGGVDRKIRGTNGDPGGRAHSRPVQRGVKGIPDGCLLGLPYRVALNAIDQGWLWRQDIVWHKPNPLPESVKSRCVRSHETIIHLTKTAQHYYCESTKLGHDVWSFATRGYRDSEGIPTPAVYPEELAYHVLSQWCPRNGAVLDPFIGSGTTALAAMSLYLDLIGVDISVGTVAAANRRIIKRRQTV